MKKSLIQRIQFNPLTCIIIIVIATCFYYYKLSADSYKAQVIHVLDGDTIDVLVANQKLRIRLAEINAPEKTQAYGNVSKQTLIKLIKNKDVTVMPIDQDQYQRVIAVVKLGDININQEMVKLGMAWVYTSYNHDLRLPLLEARAKADKVGLWKQTNPLPPWRYRKQQK